MSSEPTLAIEALEVLVDSGDRQKLRSILNDQHPADIAESLSQMDKQRHIYCFRLLDLDNASAVLAELDTDMQGELLRELGDFSIVPIISKMSPDDAVDLLSELPKEKIAAIMGQMTDLETVEDIEELLAFEDDSAGGIMSTDYLALNAKLSTGDALQRLRTEYEDFEEDIYDVYVIDNEEKLVGRITLKELLTAPAEATVESQMDTHVIKVFTNTDQEEAAEKLGRYDLLSMPVVDDTDTLRGVITVDDVFDVIQEEATEDIYQSSGIATSGPEHTETLTYNVPLAFRARLPWLVITILIETCAATVITHFDDVIRQTIAAASFMPLLSGVTGSVATQSTCIIIRGTVTGHINWRAAWRSTFHEMKVGILLGLFCGLVTTLVGMFILGTGSSLGIVVGVSLFVTMIVGVFIGTTIPFIFHRLGIDPAHASGPLITSILDVSTMSIYLAVVHLFLSHII